MKSHRDFGCQQPWRREYLSFALVALLVGCSSGSGTTSDGGGGAGGSAGAVGTTGSAGTGGGGHGGAAGAIGSAGSSGAAGTGGVGGTHGVAGSGGATGGGGGGTAGGGGAAGGGAGAAGNGATADAGIDAGFDAGMHETDAGCQGVDLTGSGVPDGTVATASNSSDSAHTPDKAIDQDMGTDWTPGTPQGWITLTFPTPTMISAIRIHGDALPVSSEIFSISTSTSTVPVGSATFSVPLWPGGVLPDIQVTPGMYSNITITMNAGASWASIIQLWLLAVPACS